jgi:hypothetical protein
MSRKRNGFKGERTIEFKYLKKEDRWRLVRKSVDSEIKNILGAKALRMPTTIDSPFIPSEFLPKLYATLALHNLEAGKLGAFYGSSEDGFGVSTDSYSVEITIRERHTKPSA